MSTMVLPNSFKCAEMCALIGYYPGGYNYPGVTGSIILGEGVHPGERVVTPVEGTGYVSHKEWGRAYHFLEGVSPCKGRGVSPRGVFHTKGQGVYYPGGGGVSIIKGEREVTPLKGVCITQGGEMYHSLMWCINPWRVHHSMEGVSPMGWGG